MGTVTLVASGKGGVGKSTACIALAFNMAKNGNRVLLVDCDAGLGSLDKMTGVEESLVYDMGDLVEGACTPQDAVYRVSNDRELYLIAAPSSGEKMPDGIKMKKLIELFNDYYDHIILDCPAGLGLGFTSASAVADRALIVCNVDPVSVRSASVAADALYGRGIEEIRLIINRFNLQNFDKTKVMEDLDKVIDLSGIQLLGIVPEDLMFAVAVLKGNKPSTNAPAMMAFDRIYQRLEGENIPVVL